MKLFRHKSLGQIALHHSSVSILPYSNQVRIERHGTPLTERGYFPTITNRTYTATNSSMGRIERLVNDSWQWRMLDRSYPYADTWVTR